MILELANQSAIASASAPSAAGARDRAVIDSVGAAPVATPAAASPACKSLKKIKTVKDKNGNDVDVYSDPAEPYGHSDAGPPPYIVLGRNDAGVEEATIAHELNHIDNHPVYDEDAAKLAGRQRAEEIIKTTNDPDEAARYRAYIAALDEEKRLQENPTLMERLAMFYLRHTGQSDNTPDEPRKPPCR